MTHETSLITQAGPDEREAAMGSMIFALQQQLSTLTGTIEESCTGSNSDGGWAVSSSTAVSSMVSFLPDSHC